MGRQSGWRHEPGSYKACPNEAVTNFLCLHKRYVWNCPCLIWCCLTVFNLSEMASKQHQAFRMCIHPCPRYFTGRDTHVLCVACLGEDRAWSALKSCWGTGWTLCASGRSSLRRAHILRSTWIRSVFGMPAPSEEGFRAVSSDASSRFAVSGRRSDCKTTYKSRNQSWEAGTSSRILTVWKLLPNISRSV